MPSNKNKKNVVLMIEDDIFLWKVYKDQLDRAGINFVGATNGVEGLHKIAAEKPDLILLDLMLPIKNGFDVLEEIKSDQTTKHIPVIILTNLGQQSDIEQGLAMGAEDYLIKTDVRVSETIDKIKKWLPK